MELLPGVRKSMTANLERLCQEIDQSLAHYENEGQDGTFHLADYLLHARYHLQLLLGNNHGLDPVRGVIAFREIAKWAMAGLKNCGLTRITHGITTSTHEIVEHPTTDDVWLVVLDALADSERLIRDADGCGLRSLGEHVSVLLWMFDKANLDMVRTVTGSGRRVTNVGLDQIAAVCAHYLNLCEARETAVRTKAV